MIGSEAQLAALAMALIGSGSELSAAERLLVSPNVKAPIKLINYTKGLITAGEDPLGDAFCSIRSPIVRRQAGATYTPERIVEAMIERAHKEIPDPARIIDPGAGSGRFVIAAARKFRKARLIAVDVDPLALLLLRANASVCGYTHRLEVHHADFRSFRLPRIEGRSLFIGNPPYVRHHQIAPKWKSWFHRAARDFDSQASSLAGLHIHFFLRTRQLSRDGDYGAYITAAEWLDVNYGSVLRSMFANGLGGRALQLIDPKAQPFADAMATGAITYFCIGKRAEQLALSTVQNLDELMEPKAIKHLPWSQVTGSSRWSQLARSSRPKSKAVIELGEIFRVHRGTVTGSNGVWIESPMAADIPAKFKKAAITRARELIAAKTELRSLASLKRVIDLPVNLDVLDVHERRVVEEFLQWATKQGADVGYIARHRKAWWAVQFREPAPILCTYMARSAPTFVRNVAKAYHLNIAHGLYPRVSLSDKQLEGLVAYLRRHVDTTYGRTYAGGLVKFEPKEMERVLVPRLESLDAYAPKTVEAQ